MKFLIEGNTYLCIDVSHRDGGMNFFSYKNEQKGVEVSFSKKEIVEKDGYKSMTYSPMDNCNFRLLMYPYNRRSQKQIDRAKQYIDEIGDVLFELWINNKKQEIFELIKEYK